jgi:acetate kinase
MGLTPLEGIPMGTRSGVLDPTVVSYLCKKENKTVDQVLDLLNKKSGYLGISGFSSDARDLEQGMRDGNPRAELAFAIQAKRIADYIGSYYVLLGGLHAICFTAGIGENSPYLRQLIIDRLHQAFKVSIDPQLNLLRGQELLISTPQSKIKVYVIPTNEELVIARDTYGYAA